MDSLTYRWLGSYGVLACKSAGFETKGWQAVYLSVSSNVGVHLFALSNLERSSLLESRTPPLGTRMEKENTKRRDVALAASCNMKRP